METEKEVLIRKITIEIMVQIVYTSKISPFILVHIWERKGGGAVDKL